MSLLSIKLFTLFLTYRFIKDAWKCQIWKKWAKTHSGFPSVFASKRIWQKHQLWRWDCEESKWWQKKSETHQHEESANVEELDGFVVQVEDVVGVAQHVQVLAHQPELLLRELRDLLLIHCPECLKCLAAKGHTLVVGLHLVVGDPQQRHEKPMQEGVQRQAKRVLHHVQGQFKHMSRSWVHMEHEGWHAQHDENMSVLQDGILPIHPRQPEKTKGFFVEHQCLRVVLLHKVAVSELPQCSGYNVFLSLFVVLQNAQCLCVAADGSIHVSHAVPILGRQAFFGWRLAIRLVATLLLISSFLLKELADGSNDFCV